MAFMKLRCERAYATGAIRTNLNLRELAGKLTRKGMPSVVRGGEIVVTCGGDRWSFGDWEADGIGHLGWLRFTTEGDVGVFSRRLAIHGVRHKFDHSRPRDMDCDDVRCVTQYTFRWDGIAGPNAADSFPSIETFDEQL